MTTQPRHRQGWAIAIPLFAIALVCLNIIVGSPADAAKPSNTPNQTTGSKTDAAASAIGDDADGDTGSTKSRHLWTFERTDDADFNGSPDGFVRRFGLGFPKYVGAEIVPRDPLKKKQWQEIDSLIVQAYQRGNELLTRFAKPGLRLPLPPSVVDLAVDHYYRVTLDGGQFQARTRAVPADAMFQYRLRADIRCQSLNHDRAHVEVVFVDAAGDIVASRSLRTLSGTRPWTRLEVSRIVVPSETSAMFVRLGVLGNNDGLEDILGEIGFDNIRIDQYPQLQMTTDRESGIYRPGDRITVSAQALGIDRRGGQVGFVLIDHNNQVIDQHVSDIEPLTPTFKGASESSRNADAPIQKLRADAIAKTRDKSRSIAPPSLWTLPPLDPGFYRIRAAATTRVGGNPLDKMENGLTAETSLAILNPTIDGAPHGVFGWSLDHPIDDQILPKQYANFLVDSGVAWMKYPCWISPEPTAGVNRLDNVLSRIQDSGIITIGRLDGSPVVATGSTPVVQQSNPWLESPTGIDSNFASDFQPNDRPLGDAPFDFVNNPWQTTIDSTHQATPGVGSNNDPQPAQQSQIAEELKEIDAWKPQLENVMSRLTLKIRQWQLGRDDDYSFLQTPSLKESVTLVSQALQGFGQPLEIALPWPWMQPTLSADQTSWQVNVRGESPPYSPMELDEALAARAPISISDANTWLSLQTMRQDQYDLQDRIIDLVRRMMTIRKHRVQAAFLKSADDPQTGVLGADGRPGPLYLPWRTTSRLIGNLREVGSLNLPSGTDNSVMVGASRAVLVMWSPTPRIETLYLGDDVSVMDVWGRSTKASEVTRDGRTAQVIPVGPVPVFVLGADPMLLAFRMGVALSTDQLDSLLGEAQTLDVEFTNPSRETIIGGMQIEPPTGWTVQNDGGRWEAAAASSQRIRQIVVLSNSAKIGDYVLPIHFQIETVPPKHITIHRKVNVGPSGLIVDSTTELIGDDELRVSIEMTNTSDRIQSYDCLLFPPPGRTYQLRFITIPPGKTVRRDFIWSGAAQLDGQTMLLRAVEQDGNRVLNYEVVVRL